MTAKQLSQAPEIPDLAPAEQFANDDSAHRRLDETLARIEIDEALAAMARPAPNARRAGPLRRIANPQTRAVDHARGAFAS